MSRVLGPGEVLASGRRASYRAVAAGPGEKRLLRLELLARPGAMTAPRRRSLLHLGHVTDLQLADVSSPGRLEFLEALRGLPGTSSFIPAQRPQESLVAHAFDSLLRRLEASISPETGAPVDLVVSTGDNIDNAQWNELEWYLGLLGGGSLDLSGGRAYEGVQAGETGELYWHPDGGPDRWRSEYGYPTLPGLLETARRPFAAGGLSLAWLSCYGNHDGLPFGEVVPTARYRERAVSGEKPYALPEGFDPFAHEDQLFDAPELFLSGPSRAVVPDPARKVVGRREFVAAHLAAPGRPAGHGYSPQNLRGAITYFAYDATPEVRLIVLDTANLDGCPQGSIGARQAAWLEERLEECHSRHLSEDGRETSGAGEDRLVVLASHHGSQSLSNVRERQGGLEDDHPRLDGEAVRSLVGRFPNVVLWLSGHRHLNEIVPRRSAARGRGGERAGYFEVSTASVADWPSQGRLVELVANGDGTLSVLTTSLDHLGPVGELNALLAGAADPSEPAGRDLLAALHRELAANVPGAGFGSPLEGSRLDRNCELVLPAPF